MVRNIGSFSLRKGSKAVQSALFTSVAPAAAMLTLAIIGGSASLPWKSAIDTKLLITPAMAITIPYCLDAMASSLERSQVMQMIHDYAVSLEKVSSSIGKFNEELEGTMMKICASSTVEEFAKQRLNMEKYVNCLRESIKNVTGYSG